MGCGWPDSSSTHIVDVYEIGTIKGQPFLATELVDGAPLSQLIPHAIPAAVVLQIAAAIAAGLDRAHHLIVDGRPAGLRHGELTSSRILLSWDGAIKIAGFGSAAVTSERADLSALGRIIAEMILQEDLGRVPLPVLLERAEAACAGLGEVVARCLGRTQRYDRASALGADLQRIRRRLPSPVFLIDWLASIRRGACPEVAPVPPPTTTTPERGNLTAPPSVLLGREKALEALKAQSEPMITVTGPGGVGKTGFILHAARQRQAAHEGGAWFVDLTEARSASDVVHTVAAELGVILSSEDRQAHVAQLGQAIRARGAVLGVLDNFEQVVEHAGATIGLWRALAPQARFVVTSREPLQLSGEVVFPLSPLSEADGVALFVERARSHGEVLDPDDPVLGRLVRQLDGLPLASELAAARTHLLAPAAILERIEERAERFRLLRGSSQAGRHSTLRGTLDWSWSLLTPWEQSALIQLSVFRGGFSVEAAEAVVALSAWSAAPWVVEVLATLQEKSLLYRMPGSTRLRMYVSIQDYAAEQLADSAVDGAALRARHRAHYARLGTVSFLRSLSTRAGHGRWHRLALERGNLHAAVSGLAPPEQEEGAARCALALATLSLRDGPPEQGIALLDDMMGAPLSMKSRIRIRVLAGRLREEAGQRHEAAEVLEEGLGLAKEHARAGGGHAFERLMQARLGRLYMRFGRFNEQITRCEQALQLPADAADPIDDRLAEGALHHICGSLHVRLNQYEQARTHYAAALQRFRSADERWMEAEVLFNLGTTHQFMNETGTAREHLTASAAIFQEGPSPSHQVWVKAIWSYLAAYEKRHEAAIRLKEEVLHLERRVGLSNNEGYALRTLGEWCRRLGDFERAEQYNLEAVAVFQSREHRNEEGRTLVCLGKQYITMEAHARARQVLMEAVAIGRQIEQPSTTGIALAALGDLCHREGDLDRAESRFREGCAVLERCRYPTAPFFRGGLAHVLADQGHSTEAYAMLMEVLATFPDNLVLLKGQLLCKRAHIELLCGDTAAAAAALSEAEEIARMLNFWPTASLWRNIGAARQALSG